MMEDMTGRRSDPAGAASTGYGAFIFGIAILGFAVAFRLGHLNAPPAYDELYHVLAAQSWLQDGSFSVYQGEYPRVPLYTMLTAWMFDLAGATDLAVARAPNVAFGALLVAGSAVWTRTITGALGGWIFALLVLFWPSGIQLSQVIRFYALHGLLFFVGAVATYELFKPNLSILSRIALAILAVAALWFAKLFQDSTLVGILGLGVWAGLFVILPAVMQLRQKRSILLGLVVAILAGAAFAATTGVLEEIWAKYNISPWARDVTAYHRVFSGTYPLLWPVTPFLAVLALHAFPRPARFCLSLFFVGLIVHSFGGVQNIRYIYYLSPFLFALWVMGLLAILPALSKHIGTALEKVTGTDRSAKVMATTIVASSLIFAFAANDAVVRSMKIAMGRVAPPVVHVDNWSDARAAVEQYVQNGAVVIATNELAAIYYFGGFDVVFSKNWMPEMDTSEFAYDPRTGRFLIRQTQSIGDLVQTYPEGIFLASRHWWSQWPARNSVTALLQAFNATNVQLSIEEAGPVRILHWRNDSPGKTQTSARIREIVEPRMSAR